MIVLLHVKALSYYAILPISAFRVQFVNRLSTSMEKKMACEPRLKSVMKILYIVCVLRQHVGRLMTKDSSLASVVWSTNMAATALLIFEYLARD